MKRTHLLSAAVALVALLLLSPSSLDAKVDIKNVQTSVATEDDPQDPDKKKVLVTVTYDLEGTEEGKGAVISLDARLRAPGNNHDIRPLDSEMTGDFGGVVGDGPKQIVWDAATTLERLGAEGKYKTTIDISAEGQGDAPTRAQLTLAGYAGNKSAWYFTTGTVTLADLEEVDKSAICPQSDQWETTVDADATFYRGTIQNFPDYKGRNPQDPWKGPVDEDHCSGFLAAKDLGTAQERVWVNFAGLFSEIGELPNGQKRRATFVFQIRYHRIRSGKSVNEFIKMGNAGDSGQTNSFAESPIPTSFTASIDIGKEDIESSEEFDLEVLKRVYKWYEGGALVMEVRAADGGHFEQKDGKFTLVESNTAKVNDKLVLSGSSLVIDTTYVNGLTARPVLTFSGNIEAEGLVTASNLTFSPWTLGKELKLFPGSDWRADGGNLVLSAFGGAQFFPTAFKFEGGVKASKVTMDGRFQYHSATFGCVNPEAPTDALGTYKSLFGSPIGIDVGDVEIVGGAITFDKLKITKFGVKILPGFCIDEFVYTYNREKDSLGVAAKMTLPLPIDRKVKAIAGGFSLLKGSVDRLFVEVETSIPMHPPPLALKAVKFDFEKLVKGPVTVTGTAKVSHLTGEDLASTGLSYNGPFQKVAELFPVIFELEGGVKITWPTKWGVVGGLKIFGHEGLGIWLAEGRATTSMEPIAGLVSVEDGTMKLISIKDNKPLFDGSYSGSLSLAFKNPGIRLKGKGEVFIPNLLSEVPFFSKFGAMLGLPIALGSVELQMRDEKGSFKYKVGPKGKERVIEIDLGELPGPGAFKCTNCSSLGSSSTLLDDKTVSSAGADTTFVDATVTDDLGEVNFQVVRPDGYASSVLVDPSGKIIVPAITDPSIIVDSLEFGGSTVLWTVVDPMPGLWRVGVVDPTAEDVVDILGVRKVRPEFDIDVSVDGRTIVATWDPTGASDSSLVDFHLDVDNEGFNGLLIGTIDESAGRFEYVLNDSLPECSYYLHTLRYDQGDYSALYHADPILNEKSALLAPEDLAMSVDNQNNVTLTWSPVADTTITGYEVLLTDEQGNDSLIGSVSVIFNVFQFGTDGVGGKRLSVRSIAESSNRGCWSESIGVPVSSVEADEPTTGSSLDLSARVLPNPASDRIDLAVTLERPGVIEAVLVDARGAVVRRLIAGDFVAGRSVASVNIDDLAAGHYLILVVTDRGVASTPLVIRR